MEKGWRGRRGREARERMGCGKKKMIRWGRMLGSREVLGIGEGGLGDRERALRDRGGGLWARGLASIRPDRSWHSLSVSL